MKSVSTRLDNETARLIRETAEERGVSMAEVLRERVEQGMAYEELEAENERLRNEKRTLVNQHEEHSEALEYIEEERELRRRREERIERREERRNAPLWQRLRWYVFGRE